MFSPEPTPRPPETTIEASVSSGLAPRCWTTRSVILACFAASLTAQLTGSRTAGPSAASGVIAFGRMAMIGVPVLTRELTLTAPPKMTFRGQTVAEPDHVGQEAPAGLDSQPGADLTPLRGARQQHCGR